MSTPKILLYYLFTPLADAEAVRLWQWELCQRLGLKGRIIVSPHGINGTVGGDIYDVKQYLKATRSYPAFKRLDVKWADGTGEDFPRLSVKTRPELVAFGRPDLEVSADGVVGGGTHLSPQQVNDFVAEHPEAVFFDGRNAFEAEVGRFKGAVVPDVSTTHDFAAELDSGKYDHLKDKPVITYCTGGVRCEVLSRMMRDRGFADVYQVDGGIVRYGEAFADSGLWEGSLYVFDKRRTVAFSPTPAVISLCHRCGEPCSQFADCAEPTCKVQEVMCANCVEEMGQPLCVAHR